MNHNNSTVPKAPAAPQRPFVARSPLTRIVTTIGILGLVFLLTACGGKSEAEAEPAQIRTPVPTFTPTAAVQTTALPAAGASPSALVVDPQPAPAAPAESAEKLAPPTETLPSPESPGIGGPVVEAPAGGIPPVAVINTELVNSRTGPDTTYAVATVLGRGEDFDITGKTSDGVWLRICCLVDLREVWVSAEFVDSDGTMDNVPVAQAGETSALAVARQGGAARVVAAPTAAPAAAVPTPAAVAQAADQPAAEAAAVPTAAPEAQAAAATDATAADATTATAGGFELSGQEQFPETNVVRVFLYVQSGSEGLEGYTLRVTKDGVEQPVSGASFGGMPGMTWPIAEDRQRFQNFKVEFPGVAPAGVWTVALVHDGAVVGPAATFTLADNDPASELYVRYKQQ